MTSASSIDDQQRFTWKIEKFSGLCTDKLYSSTFSIGSYKWRVLLFPKGNKKKNHLSMYLDVPDSAVLPSGWSRHAQFSFALLDQIHNQNTVKKETQHEFNSRESDWGFTSFMPLSELHDPSKGFLVNDTIVVEADFTGQSHDLKKEKIICNADEKDIAEHLRIRLKKEQEEKEQKRKEKAESHLYTIIKVARDEDLLEQIGRDIYFDLVDHDKVRSFRIQKQTPFNLFKEEVAKDFGIPVQFQRFWLWAKRQNHTYRPNRPLTPQEETQSVGQLGGVSTKASNAELKLFLEVDLGQLEDGDIICFQKSSQVDSGEQCRCRDIPAFLEYVHNRQESGCQEESQHPSQDNNTGNVEVDTTAISGEEVSSVESVWQGLVLTEAPSVDKEASRVHSESTLCTSFSGTSPPQQAAQPILGTQGSSEATPVGATSTITQAGGHASSGQASDNAKGCNIGKVRFLSYWVSSEASLLLERIHGLHNDTFTKLSMKGHILQTTLLESFARSLSRYQTLRSMTRKHYAWLQFQLRTLSKLGWTYHG
ncbi:Ubiquitin carboxyl-terminal hydrolase 12 [Camellia lanceoleosa]|nr:Ubiquitin carboxyl-terminal hydrolase 12 [Camellia lanceoleosa]